MDEYNIEQLLKKINVLETELKASKKYGLVWDKENTKEAVVIKCEKNIPILEQDKSKKIICGEDNNILIEGDNYHALTSLNFIAMESVDIVYIDPPYNTGHEDFIYNDNYVDKEDGFKHSKWLSFIKVRLELAKNLLKDNGVIFISIDDNEVFNLKLLCDSIFGEVNFLGCITQNKGNAQNDAKNIQKNNDYLLVYCKKRLYITSNGKIKEQTLISKEKREFIYIDKESGKDFDRTNYKKLIKKLKKDDLLIVKSIDRLGRNYHMILEEWAHITKTIGADIKVLDMPLLDTRIEGKNLVGKFISDIVLQVLSFVAENERTNIKQRQMEGIRIAKEKGVKFGRPKVVTPPNTNDILDKYINHEITNTEAASLIGVSRGTFFRLVREHKK